MRKLQIVVLAGSLAAMSCVAASAQSQLSDGEKAAVFCQLNVKHSPFRGRIARPTEECACGRSPSSATGFRRTSSVWPPC